MKPATMEAAKLVHEGAIALAEATANGIRIDTDYLDQTIDEVRDKILEKENELKSCEEFEIQKKKFGDKTKLTSRDQLSHVLFEVQKHTPLKLTKTRIAMDDETLTKIGTPYCKEFLELEHLNKLQSTYLKPVRRYVQDGFLHCDFNLHTVASYRGSSSSPNFQNIPNRDPVYGKYIRKAFVPREGRALVEIDLKANEVRVACCYTKDPTLIHDTLEGDMHGDMAAECFMLPKDQMTKSIRFIGKSVFVFAEFYGDWYPKVAKNVWEEAVGERTKDGELLHDHLAACGITELGKCKPKQQPDPPQHTFEAHIKKVERRFWDERFSVYKKWKRDWYDSYLEHGWFQMLTGFTVQWGKSGCMGRNDCVNYPIQGSAFHCLLWAFIRLNKWLKRNKFKTLLVGQIHDSIMADVPLSELDDYLAAARRILVEDIREVWPWLIIPLGVEAEVAYDNWWEKESVEID